MRSAAHTSLRVHLLAAGVLILLGGAIYSNTLAVPFVYDDIRNIQDNPHIRIQRLGVIELRAAAFRSPIPARPVANLSFALQHYAGWDGLASHHVVNLVIHVVNSLLVYVLAWLTLCRLARSDPRPRDDQPWLALTALLAAALFVAHPIQTQAVTYTIQRMTTLATGFSLLALVLYVLGRQSEATGMRRALFALCGLAWLLALGSKQIAAAVPGLILLYELYFFRDLRLDWLRRNWGVMAGVGLLAVLVAFLYLGTSPLERILAPYEQRDFTLGQRLLTQLRVVALYISLLLFPHPARLNLIHGVELSESLLRPWTTLAAGAALLALLVSALGLARRERLVSFCLLWFLVNLVIESSVIGLELAYEHRLYLPAVGFCLLMAHGSMRVLPRGRPAVLLLPVALVGLLAVASHARNEIWRDGVTLWRDVLAKNPTSVPARVNLGNVFARSGDVETAMLHFEDALSLDPENASAHANLGLALMREGEYPQAESHFVRAVRRDPRNSVAHYNLALAVERQGRFEDAASHYRRAIEQQPDFARAYNNLGRVLARTGRWEDAIAEYRQALTLDPSYALAHYNLGIALSRTGAIDPAIRHFTEAVRLKPDFEAAREMLEGARAHRAGRE